MAEDSTLLDERVNHISDQVSRLDERVNSLATKEDLANLKGHVDRSVAELKGHIDRSNAELKGSIEASKL